jgi:8-oxo-dGTP pyrophosphatase MutT (NUDIX family)
MAKFRQAGAIIVRTWRRELRILLVTARRNPQNWIFPKGHVEGQERLQDAALREAREEAGVDGKVVGRAGAMVFEFGGNTYRVRYFIVRSSNQGQEREGRRLRWLRYKPALRKLTYAETRNVLRKAWPRIEAALTNSGRPRAKSPKRAARVVRRPARRRTPARRKTSARPRKGGARKK